MIIEPNHFEYLVVQAGYVSDYAHDFSLWKAQYEAAIDQRFQSMLPALPRQCSSVLDIGGGVSGLCVRLNEHYDGRLHVAVLDGKNTLAVVERHNQPFSNATVTQNFLRLNGVRSQSFFAPEDEIDEVFSLVVSTQAWCFHIAPCVYMEKVKKALRPGGTLIVDVRRAHPEWSQQLEMEFGPPQVLAYGPKWGRLAYVRE